MSLTPAMLDAMLAAGCTAEQIAAVVKADMAERDDAIAVKRAMEAERTRRYRQRGGGQVDPQTRKEIFERDGHTCIECGSGEALEIDHIIPLIKGGDPVHPENLQTLCRPCNARKRDRIRKADNRGKVRTDRTSVDVMDDPSLSPAPFLSPHTPQTNPHPHTHPDNISRARKAHALPADWEPVLTAKAQQTVDGWPPGQLERELAAFRDHAADKGRTSKDWQAAFRTWINNSNRWKPANGNASRNHRSDEQPANPYVRAVLARQSGAVGNGGGQSDCWP